MTIADMPARQMSMGLALSWQAARDPQRPALTMGDQTYTRAALDRPPKPTALAAFLATRLSRPKIPYTCEFVTESLRDDAGKVRRKRLREERLATAAPANYHKLR